MNDLVEIRDRRRKPYFMVRRQALRAIREQAGETRRARALGLYVVLCHMGNEQRTKDQRHRIEATHNDLIARCSGLTKRNLKALLTVLEEAQVARVSARIGPRGPIPSLIELTPLDGRFVEITVATSVHLGSLPDVDLLRSLALLVTVLELCDDQGGDHAEATRPVIAELLGLNSVRTLDGWVKALKRAGVLHVVTRPLERGGFAANLWEVIEPEQALIAADGNPGNPGADTEPAPSSEGTDLQQPGHQPGADPEPTWGAGGTDLEQEWHLPGADCATGSAQAAPHAGASDVKRENSKNTSSPPSPSSPSPSAAFTAGKQTDFCEQLCEELLAVLQPRMGDGPRRQFDEHRRQWLSAAGKVAERYSLEQIRAAFAYMLSDPIKGSPGVTMPGFERVVDELIFRAGVSAADAPAAGDPSAISWSVAKGRLEQAIRRYGADRFEDAIAELGQDSELYVRFVRQVRWTNLCAQPLHYRQFQDTWTALAQNATPDPDELAA
jgi:hypothetical protein